MAKTIAAGRTEKARAGREERSGPLADRKRTLPRTKAEQAAISRLIDGFDARLQEIEAARDALLKQLAN